MHHELPLQAVARVDATIAAASSVAPVAALLAALFSSGALAQTAASAPGPDVAAGKAKVTALCAACHGADGVSVADHIPNLAGQRAVYLETQLKALKEGARKSPVMNAMAASLSPGEISNVAAFFASLPGAGAASKSAFMPQLAATRMPFPQDYQASYLKYHTINFPATRQVRTYWASPAAVKAAREGRDLPDGSVIVAEVWTVKLDADKKPIVGADGFFAADQLVSYTGMQREAGWGLDVPEGLRNENWSYAAFTVGKQHRLINQAECLACHKPLDKTSYLFTLDRLSAAAKSR